MLWTYRYMGQNIEKPPNLCYNNSVKDRKRRRGKNRLLKRRLKTHEQKRTNRNNLQRHYITRNRKKSGGQNNGDRTCKDNQST